MNNSSLQPDAGVSNMNVVGNVSLKSRMVNNRSNRRRELARLRSLDKIQPLSPSSKSRKQVKEDKFTFEDIHHKTHNPVDVDNVSICMSPSHLAVETRLPESSPRINVLESRREAPSTPTQSINPLSPSEGVKTILNSPRMKNLRKQHQKRCGRSAVVENNNASLRRAQHHRRCTSSSRERPVEMKCDEETGASSSAGAPSVRTVSTARDRFAGRSLLANRRSVSALKTDSAATSSTSSSSLMRARRYRRCLSNSRDTTSKQTATAPTPKASNAKVRTRQPSSSPSKAKENTNHLSIELNDIDIFTDFHLVMMAASSDDSSLATASSIGSNSTVSGRRKKLMGRKFKSITKNNPSHHNAIAKLVSQKKKNIHIPLAQLTHCIIPIQTRARVFLGRLAAEKRMYGIIIMQSLIRRWKWWHYFSSCKLVALRMQACYRGYIAREEAIILHAKTFAVTRLQACYRGRATRSALIKERCSATKIQAVWRGYWRSLLYSDALDNAVLIQSIARMRRQRKMFLFVHNARLALEAQLKAETEEAAALTLQTFWRGSSCRANFCNTVIDVVIVQSVVRRWSGIQRVKSMQAKRNAATKIQSWIRGCFDYFDYMLVLSSTVSIQTFIRRSQAIDKLEQMKLERYATEMTAATKIAAEWRRYAARSNYFDTLIDVIICQSIARRRIAVDAADVLRKELEKVRQASAALIQHVWRESRIREVQSNMMLLKQLQWSAATSIAATWRRFVCEEEYRLTLIDTITCQKAIRHFLAKRRKMHLELASASLIQAVWRMRYCRAIAAATSVQAQWRAFYIREAFLISLEDITTCQSVVRRHIACTKVSELRSEHQHNENVMTILLNMEYLKSSQNMSATLIASLLRRLACEKRYYQTKSAIAVCQSAARMFLTTKRDAHKKERAAIICQSAIRRKLACTEATRLQEAKLQARILEKIRRQSIQQKAAATRVARVWRRVMCEKKTKKEAAAATRIASVWRGYVARTVCIDILIGVILFQSQFRRKLASKQVEALRQKRKELCATKIQASWRVFSASIRYTWDIYDIVVVQSLVRRKIAIQRVDDLLADIYELETSAATKIQTCWRGFSEYRDFMIFLGDIILCQSVIRRHFACEKTRLKRHQWQMAERILQIAYNMNHLATVEQSSAAKIASAWKLYKKARLTNWSSWRKTYAERRISY